MRKFGRNLGHGTSLSSRNARRIGVMKAPEGEGNGGGGGAGTGDGGGNNGSENAGGGGTGDSQQNNNGQEFKPTAFWDDPAPEAVPPANQQQQQQNTNQQQQNGGGNDLGSVISERVKQYTASPVMTPETMEAIGTGDYTKFEKGLNEAIQGSMKENLTMVVQLMGKFGEHLESKFGGMIDKSFDGRDSKAFLREQIPTSKNEGVQPIIDALYDRALKVSKGDKTSAVEMTKRMMRAMSEDTASDLNLHVAPVGSDSDPAPTKKTNWLEALNMS